MDNVSYAKHLSSLHKGIDIYKSVIFHIFISIFSKAIRFCVKNYFDVKMLVGKYYRHHFGSKLHVGSSNRGSGKVQTQNLETEVLVALRQIVRAIDQHSSRLSKDFGLTTPQLLVLQTVASTKEQPIRAISAEVNLSQATVTSIVDRLERRGLLERQRSGIDRRQVFLVITEAGVDLLTEAPKPLQENFLHRFEGLREWEQHQVVFVLKQVAEMMGARHIDAAPLLDTGDVTRGHQTPETQPDSEPAGPIDNQ